MGWLRRLAGPPFALCLLLVGLVAWRLPIPALERFEYVFLDHFFRWRPPIETSRDLVYVEIDEASLQTLGRWPWPRRLVADLIRLLTQWQAKAVVVDILFSEPSPEADDQALEEALAAAHGRVYLPLAVEPHARGRGVVWIRPLPRFARHINALGHINVTPDSDGNLRRIVPYLSDDHQAYPQLALQAGFDTLGQPVPPPGAPALPVDARGRLLINWAGPWQRTFTHYSALDLLRSAEAIRRGQSPLIPADRFRGKICLVGLTAVGTVDIKGTPVDPAMPALGLHASVINSVLTHQWIRPASRAANAAATAALGVLASLLFVLARRVGSFMAGLWLGVNWVIVAFLLFWRLGVWFSVVHPLLLVLFLFVAATASALVAEQREQRRLRHLATRDGLTGLYVKRHVQTMLDEAIRDARARGEPLSVIMADIDHFKQINDTHGHQAGDQVLAATAQRLQASVRQTRDTPQRDTVSLGRYGGEEFLVVVRNADLAMAERVAERLRRGSADSPVAWESQAIPVTISLGVGTLHPGEVTAEAMIRRADEALYEAKRSGRNRVCAETREV